MLLISASVLLYFGGIYILTLLFDILCYCH